MVVTLRQCVCRRLCGRARAREQQRQQGYTGCSLNLVQRALPSLHVVPMTPFVLPLDDGPQALPGVRDRGWELHL